MKKATKMLAVALAVALLATMSLTTLFASAQEHLVGDKYVVGEKTYNLYGIKSGQVMIDGDLKEWPAASKYTSMSEQSLINGDGQVWHDEIEGSDPKDYQAIQKLTADAYIMYDDAALYLGWVATYAKHKNGQPNSEDLWREDCVQVSISMFRDKGRNEFGFALSTWGAKTPLPYVWDTPEVNRTTESGDKAVVRDLPRFKNRTTGMYVLRDDTTQKTTYEIRVPYEGISTPKKVLQAGDSLYMAFSFKTEGGFYEWGDGVIGGQSEKDINLARQFKVGAKTLDIGTTSTTPTAKPTDKPTEKPTDKPTEKPTGITATPTGTPTATPTGGQTAAPTAAPTTATVPPGSPIYPYEPAGAALANTDAVYTAVETKVGKVADGLVVTEVKKGTDATKTYLQLATPKAEQKFKGVYQVVTSGTKNTVTEVTLMKAADAQKLLGYAKDNNYYDTSKVTGKLFVVYENVPTTTVDSTTSGTEDSGVTVGPATGDTTTTTKNATTTGTGTTKGTDEGGGSLLWLWILLGVLVLAGAGVALYFFVFKKKGDDDEN